MGKAFLVTGTDTGVGKTVVAGGLALGFRRMEMAPGVFKPVESGVVGEPLDGLFLKKCSGTPRPLAQVVPYSLEEPLAPAVAAEREGVKISLEAIRDRLRDWTRDHPVTLVEGAGGLLVPITGTLTYADLARWLDLSILIVARPSLGTINHTLLTVRVARAMGLRVLGVVISGYPREPGVAEETNSEVIERMGDVDVLALVPRIPGVFTEKGELGELETYPWEELAGEVWERMKDEGGRMRDEG